jgi:hypothetical protein
MRDAAHKVSGCLVCEFPVEGLGDDHIHAEGFEQGETFSGSGEQFEIRFAT